MEELKKLISVMENVGQYLEDYNEELTEDNLNQAHELLTDLFMETTKYLTIIKDAKFKEDLEKTAIKIKNQ